MFAAKICELGWNASLNLDNAEFTLCQDEISKQSWMLKDVLETNAHVFCLYLRTFDVWNVYITAQRIYIVELGCNVPLLLFMRNAKKQFVVWQKHITGDPKGICRTLRNPDNMNFNFVFWCFISRAKSYMFTFNDHTHLHSLNTDPTTITYTSVSNKIHNFGSSLPWLHAFTAH